MLLSFVGAAMNSYGFIVTHVAYELFTMVVTIMKLPNWTRQKYLERKFFQSERRIE